MPVKAGQDRGANDGFTLLELLVVMVIVGLLASYVAPRFFAQIGKSEIQTAKAQINALEKALSAYRVDTGRFPTTQEGLNALIARPPGDSKWFGPYLSKAVPLDPWGRPYVYHCPGAAGRDFELRTYGKDGKEGGEGEDQDHGA